MRLGELLGKIDRVQQSLTFKVVASIIAVAIAVGVVVTYSVRQAAMKGQMESLRGTDFVGAEPAGAEAPKAGSPEAEARKVVVQQAEALARFNNKLRSRQLSIVGVGATVGLVLVPVLGVVWLGVGLTYLGLGVLAAGTVWPMVQFGSARWQGIGVFIGGVLVLAGSFSALLQLLRLLLSASLPVTAIARNVVAEGVRMKISLVFIVLLILGLSVLPGLLDPATPLRYRVQSFLQYATAGTFWVSAILVLTLSAASVCFEQRDKIVWQTMTKPVRAWEFVLGKWLGVFGVAAVLVGVSCTGIFFFTDYLRRTGVAVEEVSPYVPQDRGRIVTDDRLALDSQVLVGRLSERPRIPNDLAAELDQVVKLRLAEAVKKYEQSRDPAMVPDEAKIRAEASNELLTSFFSLAPGAVREYTFYGLERAKDFDLPMTLRYKVNVGASNPTDFGMVTFFLKNTAPLVRRVPAGQVMSMPILSSAIEEREEDGKKVAVLALAIGSGDGSPVREGDKSISLPFDGFEVTFVVSSFEANFLRVALVMLLKLGLLGMVAVVAGTFLAFPVACLLSFGVMLMAEGAGAVGKALDMFDPIDGQTREVSYWKYPVQWIATPVSQMFGFYSRLDPTGKLVEGRLVSWGDVGYAALILGGVTVVLGIVGSVIFRNRELATYSGQ